MIFGSLRKDLESKAVAVAFIMTWRESGDGADAALGRLAGFRRELYWCLGMRRDALFEACDALACKPGRVLVLAELCLEPECRRGHGGLYDALNSGEAHFARLRRALPALPLPAWDDGRIRLACDVSNWLRPDAETSPERLFCHCCARGKGNAQMIPGWPYSFVAALEPGRTSWALPLDAVRPGPEDDATEVTAAQVRDVVTRVIAAGHWKGGDPGILAVFDSGYDLTRLAWLLGGLPLEVCGRLRSDRVMYFPAPPREPGATGRPPRHGAALRLAGPASWPEPAAVTVTEASRYGTATAAARGRLHQRLTARAGWERHEGELPVIEGTLIRLQVGHLPGQRDAEPLWLWSSRAGTSEEEVDRAWQAFLRRFDIEHMFRFLKQALGWTRPNCAARPPPTAGPGSSSPPTPSFTWPAAWPPASGCPGSGPARPAASPRPGYARGFAASARTCPFPPAHRNPPGPGPDAPPARRTSAPPPATTWAKPSSARNQPRRPASKQVKQQAKSGVSDASLAAHPAQ